MEYSYFHLFVTYDKHRQWCSIDHLGWSGWGWPQSLPANTCIMPSFPWTMPMHCTAYPLLKALSPSTGFGSWRYTAWCVGTIQGKESTIQVLASLAPSSQTVGSNIRVIPDKLKCSSWAIEADIAQVVEAILQVAPNIGSMKVPKAQPQSRYREATSRFGKPLKFSLLGRWIIGPKVILKAK
jgi:hypothetical protein